MRTNDPRFALHPCVLAVHAALLAMALAPAAHAQGMPTAEELTKPTSTIEIGVQTVQPKNSDHRSGVVTNTNGDDTSYKFGEYNGLYKKGTTAIGNFDLRGGGAYDSLDATRWRLTGRDLGVDARSLSGEYGRQGDFRIRLNYDELFRARSDTYMTPYFGEGTNLLALPSNWLKPIVPQASGTATTNTSTAQNFRALDPVNGTANGLASGVVVPPTAATLATLANIRLQDLGAYHNVNLGTRRKASELGFSYEISPQWSVAASLKHETKDGLKPLSVVTSQNTEYAATLADPIQQTTNQYSASLNFRQDRTFLTAEYYASLFTNDIKSVTWNDVGNLASTTTYAAPPSNQFHQFSLTGGTNFTPTTRLVLRGSYARSTQDEPFITQGQNNQFPLGFPATSLHGLVVNKTFDAKLTSKPMKDLGLNVAYKYDDRDNRTPINTYFFQDANEAKSGTNAFISGQGSNLNMYANRPYSRKVNQFDVDGDWRISGAQSLKLALQSQHIDRGCPGSWINCADAPTSKEDTVKADWRGKFGEDLEARVGLAHGNRRVNYDENAFLALVPYANVVPTLGAGAGATSSVYQYLVANGLTGFGPATGYVATTGQANIFTPSDNIVPQALYGSRNNINELIGMRRYNMADRNRDKLRASLSWQASEQLSFSGNVEYLDDRYSHSVFGLLSSKSSALNLEGTWQPSDGFAATLFYTYEDKRARSAGDAYGSNNNGTGSNSFSGNAANTNISPVVCYGTIAAKNQNAKIDPCLAWTNDTHDKIDTLGLTVKKNGLFAPKFDLLASLVFTRARTDVNVTGGSYVANPLAAAGAQPGGVGNYYIAASALPTVVTDTTELVLDGRWNIDKRSTVRVRYVYARMKASDWWYDGYQFGTGTNYLPTNEQAPNYRVQVIGVSYIHRF